MSKEHLKKDSPLFDWVKYEWSTGRPQYGNMKGLALLQNGEVMEYPVIKNLGIIGLCAHYHHKKGLEMKFVPDRDNALEAIRKEVEELSLSGKESEKRGIIYSTTESETGHVSSVLLAKYGKRIGLFFYDSSGQAFGNVSRMKRSLDNETCTSLMLMEKDSSQLDTFSCRIKSVVDMRRLLTLEGDEDPFEEILNNSLAQQVMVVDAPAHLYRTVQNKKLIEELDEETLQTEVSKKSDRKTLSAFLKATSRIFDQREMTNGTNLTQESYGRLLMSGGDVNVVPKSKQAYLFDKAESYSRELEQWIDEMDPEEIRNMFLQRIAGGGL